MKSVLLVLLLAVLLCQEKTTGINKFLEMKNGAKVTVSKCMAETKLKILRIIVTPSEIIKGDDISLKVQIRALEDITIKSLNVIAHYNGVKIFEDTKDQGKLLKKGEKFIYSYVQSVPTFTPSGAWDVNLYLKNEKDENINCLLCHFDIE